MGYQVKHTKLSGDQGADLVVEKFGEKTAVQAKNYNNPVSNRAIQETVAAISHYACDNGMVVTNSFFTKGAIELAESNNVRLINRDELSRFIEEYL